MTMTPRKPARLRGFFAVVSDDVPKSDRTIDDNRPIAGAAPDVTLNSITRIEEQSKKLGRKDDGADGYGWVFTGE